MEKAYNRKIQIRDLTLKNRIVVPPMASQSADHEGFVTEKTLEHYTRLSQSRSSIVMVEYSYICRSGRSEPHQMGVDQDDKIPGLASLSQRIQNTGAHSALQIVHAGAKSSRELSNGTLLSPSGIAVPVKGKKLETPDKATFQDIRCLQTKFVEAAQRAERAGFDIVEIHAAHGYGLNQWISPITNQRNDFYGSSNLNRFRILLEIVNEIKERLPRIKISVRMPGMDHYPGGLSAEDSIELAVLLANRGVDLLNISSGIGGWKRPQQRNGEGYLVEDAERIQRKVQIPVIGVGGIHSPKYIEETLSKEKVSMLAVGRSILNNENWGPSIGLQR